MKKKILFLSIIASILPFVIYAESSGSGAGTPPLQIEGIFERFTDWVVWPIFNGVVIIMFIYAGFKYLTAKGDPTKVGEANKAMVWAVVGVTVAFFVKFMTGIIKGILGVP